MTITHTTPHPGDFLWQGPVGGRLWTVTCVSVRPRAAEGEPDEDGLATSGEPYWILSFATDGAAPLVHHWSPDSRVLHGTLPNWSKGAIGQLKRALIQFKREPDAGVIKISESEEQSDGDD